MSEAEEIQSLLDAHHFMSDKITVLTVLLSAGELEQEDIDQLRLAVEGIVTNLEDARGAVRRLDEIVTKRKRVTGELISEG